LKPQPLVTIVTPSYNQGDYLEATIQSVLHQDYPAIEYLVVDGGSSDNSVEIIRRYDKNINWWVSEKDAGQSDAINKGLRRARGEIVAWLNSDDIYESGAVSAAVDIFRANPLAGLVYGDARSIDAQGKQFNLMRARQYDLVDLLSFEIICQPASFMRRSILEQVNYLDPSYHLLMDHLLWIMMAQKATIIYTPQIWASARYHAQAKNRTRGAAYGREARVLIEDIHTRSGFSEIIDGSSHLIWAGVNRFDAFYLTDAGEYKRALSAYARAFQLHPPSALRDWKHAFLALVSWLGLPGLRNWYEHWRARRFSGGN
jgi:glycosyltransferase involved in cell wall biosynthesis